MAVTLATVNSSYTFLNRLIIVLTYLGSWAVQTLKAVVQQTVGLKGMQTCMLISLSQYHHCNVKIQEANLSLSHYSSTRELEDYSENTFSSLLYLTLEAMGTCKG